MAELQDTPALSFCEGVVRLLERRIGLDGETLGQRALQSALSEHLRELDLPWAHGERYLHGLEEDPKMLQELIEKVVVNETWFRRDGKPFDFLTEYARQNWRHQHSAHRRRLLSLPCATGEEPYSMAISLLEAGMAPDTFRIDAVDISHEALHRAENAIYTANSFRHSDPLWRDTYFRQVGDSLWKLGDGVRRCVQFRKGNLLDYGEAHDADSYHVIFSRNLLIYLSHEAKLAAIASFRHLLRPGGLLFVGHAEMLPMLREHFQPVGESSTFAYRMEPPSPESTATRRPQKPQEQRPDAEQVNRRLRRMAGKPPRALVKQEGNEAKRTAIRAMPHVRQPEGAASPATAPPPPPDAEAPAAAMFRQAKELADNGEYSHALHLAIDCLHEDATHVPARHLCAMLQQVLGDVSGAETEFRRVLYLDPRHEASMTQLALLLRQTGREQEAAHLQRRLERRTRSGRIMPPSQT